MFKKSATRFTTHNLALMGMLSAVSILLVLTVRIPLMPTAPWLTYDMADIPILLGAFILGPVAGMLILLVTAFIHAFMLGGHNIIGFIMNVTASGALVLVSSFMFRKLGDTNRSLAISLITGGLVMTALMIPMNLIFTPLLFGMPVQAVIDMILPVLLPFNLIRAGANATIFFVVYKALRALLPQYLKR